MASEESNVIPMTREQIKAADRDRYTTSQVAEYFGVTPTTVYNWIKDGCLEADRVTVSGTTGRVGKYYIDQREIDRFDSSLQLRAVRLGIRKKLPRLLWHLRKEGLY